MTEDRYIEFAGGPLNGQTHARQQARPQEWEMHPEYRVPDFADLYANPNQPRQPIAIEHRYRNSGLHTRQGALLYLYQGAVT